MIDLYEYTLSIRCFYKLNCPYLTIVLVIFLFFFRSTFKDNLNNADKNTLTKDSSQQYSAANILTTNIYLIL
jgi:hypothetical protein